MTKPVSRYAFEILTQENFSRLSAPMSDFYREARNEGRDDAYWRWRYLDAPRGSATTVALADGRVVGLFGNTHLPFRLDGQTVTAGVMGELAIHPKERSWRCYTGLVDATYTSAASQGVAMGYAVAPGRIAKISSQIGAADLGRLPVHAAFISLPTLLRRRGIPAPLSALGCVGQPLIGPRSRTAIGPAIAMRLLDKFDSAADDLWRDLEPSRRVCVRRQADYLNWRYVRRPDKTYTRLAAWRDDRLAGIAVLGGKPQRGAGYLLELLAAKDDPAVLDALLAAALESARTQGFGLFTACFPAGSAESNALRRFRFQRWTERLWDLRLLVVTGPHRASAQETQRPNWYFSLGDWLTQ